MASAGNLIIHEEDDEQVSKNKTEYNRSVLTGKDAAVAFHFCQEILESVAVKFGATVVRTPCKGLIEELEIKYKEKCTKEIEKAIENIRRKTKSLLTSDIFIPSENLSKLTDFIRLQERSPSSFLFLADVAFNKVSILAESNEEVFAAAEELKQFIGIKKSAALANTGKKTYASAVTVNTSKSYDIHFNDDTSLKMSSDINNDKAINWKERNNNADKKFSRSVSDEIWLDEMLQNGFIFKVYKASILNVNVEVIVNAANETLMHGGGVAYVIADAAGYQLQKEGDEYIRKNGDLHVCDNYVTTAGKLKYKGVIHAVGPIWHDYKDKVTCLEKLRECIMQVFTTCNEMKFSSVGMPAISAGIFGVPKELCADMYVKAAVDFSEMLGSTSIRYPKEFHFVDIDEEILELVKTSYKKWKQNPSIIEPGNCVSWYFKSKNQFTVPRHRNRQSTKTSNEGFNNNVQGRGGNSGSSFGHPLSDDGSSSECSIKCDLKTMDRQTLSTGAYMHMFKIASEVVLKLFNSSIEQLTDLDAVVCAIGITLKPQGLIFDAIKKAGGSAYVNNFEGMVRAHLNSLSNHDVVKCHGGNRGAKNVIFLVMNKLMNADKRETELYQQGIVRVLEKANKWGFCTLALPLIGTGQLQTNDKKLKYCVEALLKGICEFCCRIAKLHIQLNIKEIHLINNNALVSKVHEDVFYQVARHQTNDRVSESDSTSLSQKESSTGFGSNSAKRNDVLMADTGHKICVPVQRSQVSSSQGRGSSNVEGSYQSTGPRSYVPIQESHNSSSWERGLSGRQTVEDSIKGRSQFGDHMMDNSATSIATDDDKEQGRDKTKPQPLQEPSGNLKIFEND